MRKRTLLAGALLAAVPLAVWAQETAPPAAPALSAPTASAASPAQPVTLRLKFTPGQTRLYTITADTEGEMQMPQSQTPMPINTNVQMILHQTVKDVRASDGAATVESGIDAMTLILNGKAFPMPEDKLAGMKDVGTTVILPTGKVLSFTPSAALGGAGAMPGMDLSHANSFGSMGQFPDAPTKIGDTWKSAISMGMAGVQAASRFSLAGVDTTGGKTIATINQSTTGTFDTSASGAAGSAVGGVNGGGQMRFDVDAGAILSQTNNLRMTMTVASPATGTTTKMHMKINTIMQLMDAPGRFAAGAALPINAPEASPTQ